MFRLFTLCFAAVGWVLIGAAPAMAATLFAQADEGRTPVLEYGVGIVASALVLLVVCWPAKRE